MERAKAYIGLGTNLGDREANLRHAVASLGAREGIELLRVSRVYETDPVGPGEQGAYLNAVVEVETGREPRELLETLLEIEAEVGRKRDAERLRWGPRILDLDLLLYASDCRDEPGLCIPHPRLHERAFVLEPLCDLVAELVHPREGLTLAELARKRRDPAAVRIAAFALEPRS